MEEEDEFDPASLVNVTVLDYEDFEENLLTVRPTPARKIVMTTEGIVVTAVFGLMAWRVGVSMRRKGKVPVRKGVGKNNITVPPPS